MKEVIRLFYGRLQGCGVREINYIIRDHLNAFMLSVEVCFEREADILIAADI